MKKDSEISMLRQQIEVVEKEKEQHQATNKLLSAQLAEEKKNNKIKLEEIQDSNHKQLK